MQLFHISIWLFFKTEEALKTCTTAIYHYIISVVYLFFLFKLSPDTSGMKLLCCGKDSQVTFNRIYDKPVNCALCHTTGLYLDLMQILVMWQSDSLVPGKLDRKQSRNTKQILKGL